jgi:hypothetical protein
MSLDIVALRRMIAHNQERKYKTKKVMMAVKRLEADIFDTNLLAAYENLHLVCVCLDAEITHFQSLIKEQMKKL